MSKMSSGMVIFSLLMAFSIGVALSDEVANATINNTGNESMNATNLSANMTNLSANMTNITANATANLTINQTGNETIAVSK